MKHILRIALCALIALPHCVRARGQLVPSGTVTINFERAEVSPSELPGDRGPLEFDTQDRPDLVFEGLEEKLAGNAFDPLAERLLGVSTEVTGKLFQVTNLKLDKAITYRDETGDNLVVQWTIDEAFGKGAAILWNSPYGWVYAMRLQGCRIGSRQELTVFSNRLVNWAKIPLIERYSVELANDDPSRSGFLGHNSRPIIGGADDFDLTGLALRGSWFLTVRAGTAITRNPSGTPADVPERFPPLTELVKKWSFDQIRAQVGAPVGPRIPPELVGAADGELYFVPTANRDRILIAELARRGLTPGQVVELVTDVKPTHLLERLSVVNDALREGGKGPAPGQYLAAVLETYRRVGQLADGAVFSLYGSASHKCAPAEEAEALKDLKDGVFLNGPMTYLATCSRSPDSLRILEQTPVPDHLSWHKSLATDQIRKRLGMPPKEKQPENPVPDDDGAE